MAATAITLLAPLAENLISQWIAYEQARKAAGDSSVPTAAQLVASIATTDAEIEATADAQIRADEA
jgi:hypothetical protein